MGFLEQVEPADSVGGQFTSEVDRELQGKCRVMVSLSYFRGSQAAACG